MNLFLSWSGNTSRAIADRLGEWLPALFPGITTFHSERDIAAGSQWLNVLFGQLKKSGFSIIVMTPDNRQSKWLLFESGALLRGMTNTRIVPYCFNLEQKDLDEPLKYLQGVRADRPGTYKLVQSINRALEPQLTEKKLQTVFEKHWPSLEKQLKRIQKTHQAEMENKLSFHQVIMGSWWERMLQDQRSALSYMHIEPDPVIEGNIRLAGKAFNLAGEPWAEWESEIAGVNPRLSKLYYKWKGWFPTNPDFPSEGFGEVQFAKKMGRIATAVGSFYDISLTDPGKVVKKAFHLKRCTRSEIEIMEGDSEKRIRNLIRKKLREG